MPGRFTPGPWKVVRSSTGWVSINDERGKIADIEPWRSAREANARLIAAAPDLYDALEEACDMLDRLGHLSAEYRAVLTKAGGMR